MQALSRCVLACVCVVGAARPLPAGDGPSGVSERIDALFAATAGVRWPGAAVLVLRDGAVVHSKAYGLANVEHALANTPRTRFRLASVSKSFTALLVLQLVEQGRLRLDDPGLVDGRILKAATLEKAWTPVVLNDGRRGAYGYGFMLVPYRGLREVAHGGDISGFNTYVAIYPTERLAVVVLSNVGMRPPGPVPEAATIAHEVADAVGGDRLGPRWPPTVALAPEVLDRYVGRYRIDAPAEVLAVMGEAIELRREGERLVAKARQGEAEIFPESETEFHSKAGPVRVSFVPGAGGAPAQAILTLLGLREFHLTRLPYCDLKERFSHTSTEASPSPWKFPTTRSTSPSRS